MSQRLIDTVAARLHTLLCQTGRKPVPYRHRTRLLLEALEDRSLPSVTFTGAGDGSSWNDPNNWDGNVVPGNESGGGSADDVIIPAGSPSPTPMTACPSSSTA
jgi:hypothetical protein